MPDRSGWRFEGFPVAIRRRRFYDIGLTLRHAASLDAFEKQHDEALWLTPKSGF
jgi:hypothetical protein